MEKKADGNDKIGDFVSKACRASGPFYYCNSGGDSALLLPSELAEDDTARGVSDLRNVIARAGAEGAPVMVIGEGPGAEEDARGLPFVGKAGQLLDKMLGAIGLSRTENTFITNVNYWRPPGNRNPSDEELELCRPFVDRMIELGQPKLIIAAGGVSAKSLLQSRVGIMKLRGSEHVLKTPGGYEAPMFPIFHPAFLLRRPEEKSRAWRDLLNIQARLESL